MNNQITLHHGDALDVLRTLPSDSIDAVVTDPPYGLAEHRPTTIVAAMTAWCSGDRDHVPDGRGFMGRAWDGFVPPPAVWDECLRVLKPGGHLLCFAGSRTADLMGMSVRLAGFEIRDTITWLYGSGFPKSLDVSKAIDKSRRRDYVLAAVRLGMEIPGRNLDDWTKETHSPGDRWWNEFRAHLAPEQWSAIEREVIGQGKSGAAVVAYARDEAGTYDVTAPATDAARQWSGWGTALKPASEPIIVARKPLAGTVAATVLAHGTGAINIDGCRVGRGEGDRTEYGRDRHLPHANTTASLGAFAEVTPYVPAPAGRWPSNVVLTHAPDCGEVCVSGCPVAELDAQSGNRPVAKSASKAVGSESIYRPGQGGYQRQGRLHQDSGTASRYFPTFRYQAKAPTAERPKVNGVAHPTVKPLALMRWLVRLVTPPGGIVLDPFTGSGTTLQAARDEGFAAIGIERETTYLSLIAHRLGDQLEFVEHAGEVEDIAPVVDVLAQQIAEAADEDALTALWEAHQEEWTDEYTALVRKRLAAFEVAA